jgi:FKBP-type peptidyl-prolyl cis-trans isomerase
MSWRILLMSFCLSLVLFACGDDKTQFEKDIEKIQNYLSENNLTATQHDSGIFYNIETEGTGGSPNQFATVIVKYKGMLLDGYVFDETQGNKTAQFNLRGTVRGFSIAATLLKRGGKGTFYLPSGLGYGRRSGSEDIPDNAVLIFEIELVDFIN